MSARLSFMVYAHGVKVKAVLVKYDKKPKYGHVPCYCCNKCSGMAFIASATQYGFFEDRHWEVYNCADCGKNTAVQYDVKLPLKDTVERIK